MQALKKETPPTVKTNAETAENENMKLKSEKRIKNGKRKESKEWVVVGLAAARKLETNTTLWNSPS